MMEMYRCSMMPGMPAEPVHDSRLSAQNVMPSCNTCQNSGRMDLSNKETIMRQLMEAGFAMDDVVLFLDTHPENQNALRYYQVVRNMRDQAMAAYESQFGPLRYTDVTSSSWDWVTEKWPWEGGLRCGSMKKDCSFR